MAKTVAFRNPDKELWATIEIDYNMMSEVKNVHVMEAIPVQYDIVTGAAICRSLCFEEIGVGPSPEHARRALARKVRFQLTLLVKQGSLEANLRERGWKESTLPPDESDDDSDRLKYYEEQLRARLLELRKAKEQPVTLSIDLKVA